MIVVTMTEDYSINGTEIDVQIIGVLEKKVGKRAGIKQDSSRFVFKVYINEEG